MFVPFETLPLSARVWIFQSDRLFSEDDLKIINDRLRAFTDKWSVHGHPLPTSFKIAHNRFIILAADESHQTASGCSIDSSVHALKELEQLLGLGLFDRNLVAFKQGDEVSLVPLQELKEKFQQGILTADTLTFNNLIATREQFENNWLLPASQTWLKRYTSNPLAKVN